MVGDDVGSGRVPGAAHAVRVGTARRRRPSGPVQALRWAAQPARPDHLARLDLGPAAEALRRFAPADRTLTWLCKADGWLLAHRAGLDDPATVCDLDDLDTVRLRSICALRGVEVARPPELTGAAGAARRLRDAVDVARWRAYDRRVARHAVPVLCSDVERRRSGLAGAAVVPNGHPGGAGPVPPAGLATTTAVFVAAFHYLPNLDAARWVAEAVAPELRRLDPAAVIRLIGAGPPELDRLARAPGLCWRGPVADTAPELRQASVALVPLRAGTGTRVKILEAWAHGVPVVSTPLGAEGLDVADGEHLLLAATAPGLARAVHALAIDPGRRQRLAAAGHRRWREAHSPDAIAAAVASVVDRALQSRARD